MKATQLTALIFALALAAMPASAYHDFYAPYGDTSSSYSRSYSAENVNVRESEYGSSTTGGRYYHNIGNYNYGRSREFSFSRVSESEHSSQSTSYGARYPYYGYDNYGRDNSNYYYPRYDPVENDYYDYRPFSDSYEMGFTSPYYNPYQYSRVGAYAGYQPYGY